MKKAEKLHSLPRRRGCRCHKSTKSLIETPLCQREHCPSILKDARLHMNLHKLSANCAFHLTIFLLVAAKKTRIPQEAN